MKLVDIQQALFAAYDIRNAMGDADRRDAMTAALENLEAKIEKEVNEYCEIFDTNHGELK